MRRLRVPSVVALGIVLTVFTGSVTLQGQAKNHAVHKLDAALRDKVAKSARGGRERVIVRVRPEAIELWGETVVWGESTTDDEAAMVSH